MISALEFTSKGDEDTITILYGGGKKTQIKKKFIEPTELFEYGVYNSETDTNPKTDENRPDALGELAGRLTERLKEIVSSLDELRLFVKENSSISHDSLDTCIQELNAYLKSIEEEAKNFASGTVN